MMIKPTDVVKAFLTGLSGGYGEIADTIRRYFTPDAVWENVGMVTTRGPAEAIRVMEDMGKQNVVGLKIDVLSIAADGNSVLVERVDHMLKADGSEYGVFRVMGAFDVENGRILAWRDYFDTAGTLAQQMQTA
jgi:limonene-1,2-epoxide hydrolase